MSGRTKIKSKVVKDTLANKDILEMFQGVLGTSEGSSSLGITYPKYQNIKLHVGRFLKVLSVFQESKLMGMFQHPQEHLEGYVEALKSQLSTSFVNYDFSQWVTTPTGIEAHMERKEDYKSVPPAIVAQFNETYSAIKKCSLVNTLIVTCKNLIPYKKYIGNPDELKDRFLIKGASISFCPFPDLPQLNFRQMYIDDKLTKGDKDLILLVLHKAFSISYEVYELISSPDIDVAEFVQVIMTSIEEVKKHIPRCDQAFQKIIESVDMLKGNFKGYYKDFTASGNPTIIMENFVLDVSKNTQSSPTVTAQFRRIITHYRKLASQQASNPKLQSLFAQVDANFQELEKQQENPDNDYTSSDSEEQPIDVKEEETQPKTKVEKNRRRKLARRARQNNKEQPDDDIQDPT